MTVLAQCCCGYTLKKGTIIIAALYLSWSIMEVAVGAHRLRTLHSDQDPTSLPGSRGRLSHGTSVSVRRTTVLTPQLVSATSALLIAGLALAAIQAVCAVLLLLGATKEIPNILFPWVVVETLVAILSAVIEIITCIAVITPGTAVVSILGIIFAMVYVVFTVHFLRVVYDYYQTLVDHPKFYLRVAETVERGCRSVK